MTIGIRVGKSSLNRQIHAFSMHDVGRYLLKCITGKAGFCSADVFFTTCIGRRGPVVSRLLHRTLGAHVIGHFLKCRDRTGNIMSGRICTL